MRDFPENFMLYFREDSPTRWEDGLNFKWQGRRKDVFLELKNLSKYFPFPVEVRMSIGGIVLCVAGY